jgi:hypothetical protein
MFVCLLIWTSFLLSRTFLLEVKRAGEIKSNVCDLWLFQIDLKIVRTYRSWFQMLHLIVYFVYQSIPIGNVPATLLKVRRFDNVLEQDRIKMKGVIGAPYGDQIPGAIVLKRETTHHSWYTYLLWFASCLLALKA